MAGESIFDFEWALTSWLCMHQYCLRYWNVEGTDLMIGKRWEAVSRNTRHTRDHQEQTSPFSYPSSLPRKDDGQASQLWQRFPCHLWQGLIMSVFVDLRTASPGPHWFESEECFARGLGLTWTRLWVEWSLVMPYLNLFETSEGCQLEFDDCWECWLERQTWGFSESLSLRGLA